MDKFCGLNGEKVEQCNFSYHYDAIDKEKKLHIPIVCFFKVLTWIYIVLRYFEKNKASH